ncbi:hypothetical protein CBW65_04380 [Tumebacillus avium]|uniref:Uncharacterized protein n=1 Tax=Tumebacillus avium TaxID=1903704 RepID=A0A1Y0IIV1_9BACL|nr:aminotransferase class III-fold pyridoxal phosphate-dependent enzyme [Tumebacillus avium]ARU60387.1 hypothetical protein CBW65_04380 [Tumebacillus avium]
MRFQRSLDLNQRLSKSIASRVWCPLIPAAADNIIFASAEGAYLYDVDGTRYVDFNNGKGSVLLGHNDADVNSALQSFAESNQNVLTGPSEKIVELAERIAAESPGPENQVAFFSTGTDAVRAAASIVKQATSKQLLASSGYHGWDPMWQPSNGLLEPNEHGVIDVFFTPELLETCIARYGEKLGGLILSPDYVYLQKETYIVLFDLCRQHGLLIVVDDVKQGYRYGIGPSVQQFGLNADLYVYSKGLSNGRRVSCVVGDRSLMRAAEGFTYTTYYESSSVVAALATLDKLKAKEGYQIIRERGDKFLQGLRGRLAESGLPIEVNGMGNLFQFVFGSDELSTAFYEAAVWEGIIFYAGDNQTPSLAFTEAVYQEVQTSLDRVLSILIERFAGLIGMEVSPERRFLTAWGQMDGASDCLSVQARIDWTQRLVYPRQPVKS